MLSRVGADRRTSNRECSALSTCLNGQFEATAPTAFSDRVCEVWRICSLEGCAAIDTSVADGALNRASLSRSFPAFTGG